MAARRLPVLGSSLAPEAAPFDPRAQHAAPLGLVRRALPGSAIAIGDTGDGELSLGFAALLVGALSERGVRAPVYLAAFGNDLPGSPAARARFESAGPLSVLQVSPGLELASGLAGTDPRGLWLALGAAALIGFEAKLSILLGAERSLLRWPEALRAARGSFTLELSEGGNAALALALADGLVGG